MTRHKGDLEIKILTQVLDRPLRACKEVYEELYRGRVPFYPPSNYYPRPQITPQILPPPIIPRKRSQTDQDLPTAGGRAIQPRPPNTDTTFQSVGPTALASPAQRSPSDAGSEPRKKRGRPSRADREAAIALAEARGEKYEPPKKRPSKKSTASPGASMQIDRVMTPSAGTPGTSSFPSDLSTPVPRSPENRRVTFSTQSPRDLTAPPTSNPAPNQPPQPPQPPQPTTVTQGVSTYPPTQPSTAPIPRPSWIAANAPPSNPPYASPVSATAPGTVGPVIPNRESSKKAMTSPGPQFPTIQSGP